MPLQALQARTSGARLVRLLQILESNTVDTDHKDRQTASLLFMTILPAHSYRNVFLSQDFILPYNQISSIKYSSLHC